MKKYFSIFLVIFTLSSCTLNGCNTTKNTTQINNAKNNGMNIFKAIDNRDINTIKEIISTTKDINTKNNEGQTPLIYATYKADNEIAFILIDAGANVNTQDNILNSPFLYAGAEGNLNLVKKALQHGADFTVFNRYGGTALIPAAEKGHIEVVKLLVNTPGFPKNHVNKLGWTALMEAVVLGSGGTTHTTIVDELIKGGVDVNIPDKEGISALQHAKNRKFTAIIKLLEKAGAK